MIEAVEEDGEVRIVSKAVKHFPDSFVATVNANVVLASRLWRDRASFVGSNFKTLHGERTSLTRRTDRGCRRVDMKARHGRGRRRPPG